MNRRVHFDFSIHCGKLSSFFSSFSASSGLCAYPLLAPQKVSHILILILLAHTSFSLSGSVFSTRQPFSLSHTLFLRHIADPYFILVSRLSVPVVAMDRLSIEGKSHYGLQPAGTESCIIDSTSTLYTCRRQCTTARTWPEKSATSSYQGPILRRWQRP